MKFSLFILPVLLSAEIGKAKKVCKKEAKRYLNECLEECSGISDRRCISECRKDMKAIKNSCFEKLDEQKAQEDKQEKVKQKIISILQGNPESQPVEPETEKETQIQLFEQEAELLAKEDEIEVLRYHKEQLEKKLAAEAKQESDLLAEQIAVLLQQKKELDDLAEIRFPSTTETMTTTTTTTKKSGLKTFGKQIFVILLTVFLCLYSVCLKIMRTTLRNHHNRKFVA
ncbi:Oidioi.mRNA.OKI2018_I69.chr2.g4108.t1.cds [Oikopleura dioica]|uniref:Oidioi.mRNA.OKI2018_I69.chr2.g4108.t1.cds n=1 Tax=Oikopleura dioica TaxID=34765 RepID=A0ABN7T2Q6_OIKDI|nr:Oidioi.mRNA.OKI2018_I69.chr2.g4108.t1.cds [Oikopleura dioica]